MSMTIQACSHCGKLLKRGEREYCEKIGYTECTECTYMELLGIATIEQYNDRLRRLNQQQELEAI